MPLTDRQREALVVHIPFELDMLDYTLVRAGAIAADPAGKLDQILGIDGFFTHARTLIEFYKGSLNDQPGRTLAAIDFTNTPVEYPSFEKYMELINDQVVHLNLDRGTNAKQFLDGKDMNIIKRKLDTSLMLFQENLDDDAARIWKYRNEPDYMITVDTINTACTVIYENVASSTDIPSTIRSVYIDNQGRMTTE